MLLEVKGCTVLYGKAKACEDVTFSIQEGEIVSIIGANGAGKTTILKTISGLKKPANGEVWFKNQRIEGKAPHIIAKTGIAQVPAGRMIFTPMTVLENLKLGASLNTNRDKFDENLKKIYEYFPKLEEKRLQLAGQLSGGQQQMLAVARALMAEPKLLLMDEPCVGLSPILVSEIGNIIQEINKWGISILLVEQNCRMALQLANRAYVMEIGCITLQGKACDLINNEKVQKCYLGGI
ncbi:MAG: ABC transporter ATP-binding protein [Dehalococcoidales bacterium]|nr:ABC transporter ATP-binding protein [Dehalococcoidales bacterium]